MLKVCKSFEKYKNELLQNHYSNKWKNRIVKYYKVHSSYSNKVIELLLVRFAFWDNIGNLISCLFVTNNTSIRTMSLKMVYQKFI